MPESEITPISAVPPPTSTTIFPQVPVPGSPSPLPAATPYLPTYTSPAPARMAPPFTARSSTTVLHEHRQIFITTVREMVEADGDISEEEKENLSLLEQLTR